MTTVLPPLFELGLDTFGDVTVDAQGNPYPQAHALRNVVAEAVLAEAVGVDAFGVGEHHRRDFAVSAPQVMLAAIAGKTERLVLGSAVTVLSTDDPVRVFERFSTPNAISNGRAEVILGRGSFTEAMMSRIGAERGWPPPTRAQFEREAGPDGALCVGSPETVAGKIVNTARLLDLSRFNMKYSNGTLAHDKLRRSIELFGTKVVPRVRELLQAPSR